MSGLFVRLGEGGVSRHHKGQGKGNRLMQETSLPKAAALILLGVLAATMVLIAISGRGASAAARAEPEDASLQASSAGAKGDLAARQTLRRYAGDTWASFVAMTDPKTGLPGCSTRSVSPWPASTMRCAAS